MTNRTKTRLLFLGMICFTLILNSVVDMHPNGIQLKELSLSNIPFSKRKFIITTYGQTIEIDDDFNKVTMIKGMTKEDINLTINNDCRVIKIVNRVVRLKTEKRTLEISNKRVDGIGRQFFGITKLNIHDIMVDDKGYFVELVEN